MRPPFDKRRPILEDFHTDLWQSGVEKPIRLKRDEKAVQWHTELIFAVSSLLTSTPSSVLSIPRKSDIRPMYDSRALFSLVYGGRNLKKRWDHWVVWLIYSQFNHCRFYQRRRNRVCLIISAKTFWSEVNDRQWGVVTCWQKSKRRRDGTKEKWKMKALKNTWEPSLPQLLAVVSRSSCPNLWVQAKRVLSVAEPFAALLCSDVLWAVNNVKARERNLLSTFWL